jgi:rhamnulokinase
MLGRFEAGVVRLEEVARFPTGPVRREDGALHWDFGSLLTAVRAGLADAVALAPDARSIGICSWAVDYGLLDAHGALLGEPFHYRDDRTAEVIPRVHATVSPQELYRRNGLQELPFTTLYQLAAEQQTGMLDRAAAFALIPDLIGFDLTGRVVAERTNASTTGLLDVHGAGWDDELIARLGIARSLFPQLVTPGTVIGTADDFGGIPVTAVGSHDTASAVVGVPALDRDFAYISCGTWGLVGVELDEPVLSEASREANFTNEGGVDGRIRYLHNVMGLWLLSESIRHWELSGERVDLPALLGDAASVTEEVPVFDADDPVFLAPDDMPTRIASWFAERGIAAPRTRAAMVRSILQSLADAFASAVRSAGELSGRRVAVIHLVGGGSRNELLCQLTADRSGLPVTAGPVEATALGNVLVQARAAGIVDGTLEDLRLIVAASTTVRDYLPRPGGAR